MAYQDVQSEDIDNVLDEIDDQEDDMIIGSELDKIRDEMNNKFISVASNMERQLARLRRKIEQEKKKQAQLRQEIQQSDAQRDEFKQECDIRTADLNELNSFYENDADEQSFNELLNSVIQRHQSLQQQLQNLNYNQNVGPMNKQWQDEIRKIGEIIKASPSKAEFASIVDEMQNRTNDIHKLQQIEKGEIPYSAIQDIVDGVEERHAAQQGDTDATYKPPAKIENAAVLRNNQQWETLMNGIKDFILSHQNQLKNRNSLIMQELGGRINDLQQFKQCLKVQVPEENQKVPIYQKKQQAAKIKAAKQRAAKQQSANLMGNIQQRHNQIESQTKNTLNMNNPKDQQKLQTLSNNDGGWRREFGQDANLLIDHLI